MSIRKKVFGFIIFISFVFVATSIYEFYFFQTKKVNPQWQVFVILAFLVLYIFLSLLQKTFIEKCKASLNPIDYLYFALEFYFDQSKYSKNLIHKSKIEEEARKILNQEQYREFSNDVDTKNIEITESIYNTFLQRFVSVISFLVLVLLSDVISNIIFINNNITKVRLLGLIIGIVLISISFCFYFYILVWNSFKIIKYAQKLENIQIQN